MLKFKRHFATNTHGQRRTKDKKYKAFSGFNPKRGLCFVQFLSACVYGQARKFIGIFLFSLLILSAMPEAARAELLGDTIKPFASVSETYDSNVFRVVDRNQLKAQVGDDQMADFITVVTIGTGLHYNVSNQALNLLLKRDFILFGHYNNQNANRDLVSGNLAFSLFDKLKLTLDGNYVHTPEPRSDYRSREVNERQELSGGATIGYEMTSGLGLAATYRRINLDYSLPQYRANQYVKELFAGTVSFSFSPDTKIYGTLQREYQDYESAMRLGPLLVNNSSVSDSIRIGVKRVVGAKTVVSGYVGYLERRHDQAPGRNFNGVVGQTEIIYGVSPLLTLKLSGERLLYEETYSDRIYSVNDAFGFGLAYQLSSKVNASIFDKLTWKSFKDVPNAGVAGRSDFLQEMNAGLEWTPLTRLTLSLGYQFSTRDSDDSNNNFSAHAITTGVAYKY